METIVVTMLNDYNVSTDEHPRVLDVMEKWMIPVEHLDFYLKSFQYFGGKDNCINSVELGDAMRCCGANPTQKEINEQLAKYDTNGSGSIELSEFIEMTREVLQNSDPLSLQKAFDSFDTNNDGFISLEELRNAMTAEGETMSEEELQEMLEDLDIDGDKKVNIQEFIAVLKSYDFLPTIDKA